MARKTKIAAKAASKFLRDAEGIAKACSVKLPKQRNRRVKALDEVRQWLAAPGFPAKQKNGYWLRAEVLQWHRKKSGVKSQEPEAATPLVSDPAQLDLMLEKFTPDYQQRLRGLYVKWQNPVFNSLKDSELRELVKAGLVKDETAEAVAGESAGDEIYGGLDGIATAISNEFKVPCHKAYVSDWLKGKRAPCPAAPPMPPAHTSGRHKRSLVFPWYREHVLKQSATGELPLGSSVDYRSMREKAEAEAAVFNLDLRRKENDERYVLREVAGASVAGALQIHHGFVKRQCERSFTAGVLQRLQGLGFNAEQLARIGDACRATGKEIISAVEADCAQAGREPAKTE